MKYLLLTVLLGGCSLFGGGKDDADQPGTKPPKERYSWVHGPIVHPTTGRHCSNGYCAGRPLKDSADSGCNSSATACPYKK